MTEIALNLFTENVFFSMVSKVNNASKIFQTEGFIHWEEGEGWGLWLCAYRRLVTANLTRYSFCFFQSFNTRVLVSHYMNIEQSLYLSLVAMLQEYLHIQTCSPAGELLALCRCRCTFALCNLQSGICSLHSFRRIQYTLLERE